MIVIKENKKEKRKGKKAYAFIHTLVSTQRKGHTL